MYIIVMDHSTETVSALAWNVKEATNEEVECLLGRVGYHLSQISYMSTKEEPELCLIEVSDLLEDE